MHDDSRKTRAELIDELTQLREQIERLEHGNGGTHHLDTILRQALETSRQVVYYFDIAEDCYHYLSPHASPADLPARRFDREIENLHPDDARRYRQVLETARKSVKEGKAPFVIEYRRRLPEGGYRWFREHNTLFTDKDGNCRCLVGLAIDITDQKNREEQLSSSHRQYEELSRQFRAILDAVPDNLTLQTADYRIVWANHASLSNLELSEEAVIGNICYELWHNRTEPCEVCPVRSSFTTGELSSDTVSTPDGRRWELYAVPIMDDTGTVTSVVELGHDATTRQQLAESQLKTRKLEALGVLAGGIAHNFNNLLAGIQGNIGLAKMLIPPAHEAFDALTDAERVSERAKRLTNQFLTFSRGGSPVREATDMVSFLREQAISAAESYGVTVVPDISDSLPACDIDRIQFEQVIHNLIMNAAEAMKQPGTVTITAVSRSIGKKSGLPLTSGSYVVISVADNGPGIPEQYLGNVFDPYFTTKELGHGLGLAVAFSIVQKHHGHIEASSPPGGGAIFKIYLPAGSESDSELNHSREPLPDMSGLRILFMDDDPIIRTTAGRLLASHGFLMETAGDGETAVDHYRAAYENGAPFDLVILDLTVQKGMGGKAALDRIRKINPSVRAVVSSGYYNDPAMADFRSHGFLGKAEKPYRIDELMQVIRRVMSIPPKSDG